MHVYKKWWKRNFPKGHWSGEKRGKEPEETYDKEIGPDQSNSKRSGITGVKYDVRMVEKTGLEGDVRATCCLKAETLREEEE